MKQDLLNWLNAIDTEDEDNDNIGKNTSEETGLLLAPLSQQPVNEPVFPVVNINKSPEPEQHEPGEVDSIMQELQNWQNDFHVEDAEHDDYSHASSPELPNYDKQTLLALQYEREENPDNPQELTTEHEEIGDYELEPLQHEPDTSEFILPVNNEHDDDTETLKISHELHDLQEAVRNLQGNLDVDAETENETQENSSHEQTELSETPSPQLNPDWKNANTGFELSLDEPPPEIWIKINAEKENPEDLNYEATSSLQGAAYIPKPEHGKNFTQRLQKILQTRKQKAEAERELEEAEHKNQHPYLQKAMIICGTLLIVLFFTWLSLWFIRRETPEGMNTRAEKLYEQGNFEEAEKIYQRAYQRYPNILTFLAKFADSAEKAGHLQTAEAAKREYTRNFPDEQREKNETNEKKRDDEQTKQEIQEQKTETKPEQVKTEPVKITQPNSVYHDEKLTFDEYLQEGTHAFNVGMYNRAVINFFRAYDIDSNDPRPYIGLAGAYRAKGLYFDAKVILDEARKKFRRNPTIEMERKFLREAK